MTGEGEGAGPRIRFERLAPVFPVTSVDAAADLYRRLGFSVEVFAGDAGYGFARRDSVEIHVAGVADLDPLATTSAIYLWVDDATALHAEWIGAVPEGRHRRPQATDYGLDEGAYIDPWGNLIRYGSPS